ncbi:MAG TPA: ABC transporter permease [Thermoanaerobaculia bacterium]|nr:ABC transporter permease [Thermoanaerobaculia bacterium]
MLRSLGGSTRDLVADAGALWRLAAAAFTRGFVGPFRGERVRARATLAQAVRAGVDSLPLVALICFLVGMIMALQSAYQLRQLGAMDLVAGLVAVSMTRELAPLLTAIVVTGRFGSAIAAELGTMRVSQEIDALQVMGLSPVSFLVVPRLVALVLTVPCLVIFADVIGIVGGQAIAVAALGIGAQRYVALTLDALVLQDVYTGLVKAAAFGAIIGLVGCHEGLKTTGGAEEVGRSTTSAVVRSIVLVIAADLFATALFYVRG